MSLGRDLTDPRWMWAKAAGFVVIACLSAGLLLLKLPTLECAALLGLTVWSCCRLYYFAFYVIERYIDPSFRFSGLGSFVSYVVSGRARRRDDTCT